MPVLQEMMTICRQQEVAHNIFELILSGTLVQDVQEPGQFLNLKVPSETMLLRRPISISSWNKQTQTLTLLYRSGDETTGTYALSQLKAGDKVDVLGPLGNGFDTSNLSHDSKIVIVGGGIGVPPLYELAKILSHFTKKITVLAGFSSKNVVILKDAFCAIEGVTLQISTDDGSEGFHGHVGQLIDELTFVPDAVFACGPNIMLKSVAQKFLNVENLQLSLEERMACGVGACYACVIPDKSESAHALKVCEDGPVFQAQEVQL